MYQEFLHVFALRQGFGITIGPCIYSFLNIFINIPEFHITIMILNQISQIKIILKREDFEESFFKKFY